MSEDGVTDRVEGRRKLGQEIVTGSVHDAAPVLSDAHRDLFAIVREGPDRGGLVARHESAVADHVRTEDRGELAFDGVSHRVSSPRELAYSARR